MLKSVVRILGRETRAGVLLIAGTLVLQFLDVATTAVILHGGGREYNPFTAHVLASAGFAGLITYKVLLVAGIACCYAGGAVASRFMPPWIGKIWPRLARIFLTLILMVSLIFDLSNIAVILAYQGVPIPHL